jgi:small subunit ribosomal protein S1
MSQNDEEDFAALLDEYEKKGAGHNQRAKRKEPQPGEEVRGRVVSIGRDAAFVDLGAKSDGMIELAELRDADGKLTVQVGDELQARVVDGGERTGVIVLKRMFGRGPEGKDELAQAYEHQIPVEGMVNAVNKGGVEVSVAGVRAFCPISQLELRHVEDANAFVGQKLTFRITRYETAGRNVNVVLSRRALLEEAQVAQAAETRAKLEPGVVLRGRVTSLKDYGAFVDLGGIEGMLHISELGFQRVKHPKDVLTVGQEVEVQVLRLEKTDDPKRPERVALSLKSLERDPWADAKERFPEGAKMLGTVARVETFGAFVELAPGIEGLIHVSELGQGKHVRHAKEVVKPGQSLEVLVLSVDPAQRRLSLGLGTREDNTGSASDAPRAPTSLGTFGDLLSKSTKKKK